MQKKKLNNEPFALWDIVEVLSLGSFIELYQLYYSMYPSKDDYSSYLWSVKFLRNAAAHNSCLLNSIRQPYQINIHKTKEIMTQISKINSVSQSVKAEKMKNPLIHDFIVLVYVFCNLIPSKDTKNSGKKSLNWLFKERMLLHKDYFEKNDTITSSYKFVSRVVEYFGNKFYY